NPFFLKVFSDGRGHVAVFLMVAITLTGCAWFPTGPKIATPDVGGFAVKGRMAGRHGDDGFPTNLLCEHGPNRSKICLWRPIGQGHSRFIDANGEISVSAANGDVFQESSVDAAMRRWLGFSLPIDALTHWVRGERAPGYAIATATADAAGDLIVLDQLAW